MPTDAAPSATVFRVLAGAGLLACALAPRAPARALESAPFGRVWYVDNTAPEGGDGSLVAPFSTLERAERAADHGDTLYLFRGDGTTRGLDRGIRLKPGQRLVGSGAPLTAPGEEPLLPGEPPVLAAGSGAVIELAERSSVLGLAIAGGGAEVGIRGRGLRAARIENVRIDGGGTMRRGLELRDVEGIAAAALSVSGVSENGVLLERAGSVVVGALRVDHGGSAGAAVVVRNPAGQVDLLGPDLHPATGAALAVEADSGSGTVVVQGASVRGPREGSADAMGIEVVTGGEATLELRVGSTVLADLAGGGVSVRAAGGSRLALRLAGNGFAGERLPAEAVVVHVSNRAEVRLDVVGNDLLARDAGLLLTASGDAVVLAEVAENAVARVRRGRGLAVVLGDRAEGALHVARNRLAGHLAEGVYVTSGGQARLGVELRDNVVASPGALTPPAPALLLQARDEGLLCLALAGNQVAEPAGGDAGAPAIAIRQHGGGAVALAGFDPAATGARPDQYVAAGNRLGRVELTLEQPLEGVAGRACPADLPPRVAASPAAGSQR